MDSLDLLGNWPQGPGRFHGYALAAMEPMRKALSLHPRLEVVPDKSNRSLGALATYEQKISVPAGTLVCACSGVSEQAEGFTVQVQDAGTGANFYPTPLQLGNAVGGAGYPLGIADGAGVVQHITQPLALLGRPRVVPAPGFLKVRVVNLSALPNLIQLVLHCVVPPDPGEPRNEWNDLLDSEAELAQRAIRTAGGATQGTTSPSGVFTPGATDALDLPSTPVTFDITAAAAGNFVLVPGAPGYRIAIYELDLQAIDANQFQLLNGAKNLRGLIDLKDSTGYMRQTAGPKEPHWVLDDGAAFSVTVSGAGRFTGDIQYRMLEHWGV
jgi:hypothetical protein